MLEKPRILIFPGLGDNVKQTLCLTRNWESKFGVSVRVSSVCWKNTNESLDEKLESGNTLINENLKTVSVLFLMGLSGGGSFAYNLFCQRLDQIPKMINVCGRMRRGENVYPTLDQAAGKKMAFRDSVLVAEKNERLNLDNNHRVMTIRPRFGDEVVPPSSVTLEGARNIQIPTTEHILSIYYALWFPHQMIQFLLQEENYFTPSINSQ